MFLTSKLQSGQKKNTLPGQITLLVGQFSRFADLCNMSKFEQKHLSHLFKTRECPSTNIKYLRWMKYLLLPFHVTHPYHRLLVASPSAAAVAVSAAAAEWDGWYRAPTLLSRPASAAWLPDLRRCRPHGWARCLSDRVSGQRLCLPTLQSLGGWYCRRRVVSLCHLPMRNSVCFVIVRCLRCSAPLHNSLIVCVTVIFSVPVR